MYIRKHTHTCTYNTSCNHSQASRKARKQGKSILKQERTKQCYIRGEKEIESLKERIWDTLSEAMRRRAHKSIRRLNSSLFKTKQMIKMWETLKLASFYRRRLISIHTMGDWTWKISRVSIAMRSMHLSSFVVEQLMEVCMYAYLEGPTKTKRNPKQSKRKKSKWSKICNT